MFPYRDMKQRAYQDVRTTGYTGCPKRNATRYIFPKCQKTMRPLCILHTSLTSYVYQLTNVEISKLDNTPEWRCPPKGHNPSKLKFHTRDTCVFALNVPIQMA